MSNKRIGNHGENLAKSVLASRGVLMVEKIGTPIKALRQRSGLYKVVWEEKVSGDHRGIMYDGRSVLAETKTVLTRNLRWSDFSEHQPLRLAEHRKFAVSLLVWVHETGTFVLDFAFPNGDFGPGHGLTPNRARVLNISNVEKWYRENYE